MSILSDFEDRVSRAVEGVFAGVFRSPVQPAEVARAAAKEMDRRRKLGVGKVYAPTLYSVLLSPEDAEQLGGFADTLAGELETYLIGYAREKDYDLQARPRVRFLVDDDLKLGRFDVIGEIRSEAEIVAEAGPRETAGAKQPDSAWGGAAVPASAPVSSAAFVEPQPRAASGSAVLDEKGGTRHVTLDRDRVVIGRLRSCDLCLDDKNVSREHAVIERTSDGWAIADLGSTNGTTVNGRRIRRVELQAGDEIVIGMTELVFNVAGQ